MNDHASSEVAAVETVGGVLTDLVEVAERLPVPPDQAETVARILDRSAEEIGEAAAPAAASAAGGCAASGAHAVNGAGITDLMHRVVTARTASAGATVPGVPASAEVTLAGIPASVPAARRFVREALPGCPRADDLMLAVSELTSNAIAHSASGQGGSIMIRVRTVPPRWARVEITDDGPACRALLEGNGWGLGIVRALPTEPGPRWERAAG